MIAHFSLSSTDKRIHVRRRGLFLALRALEALHVDLKRIAVRPVAGNQLARQIDLGLGNLVQRINLAVVHDGHVEAVVHRLVQEHAVQHAPRVGVQPERNVADAEHRLRQRQLGLDRLHRLQRLDAGGAIVFLSRRDRQRQRVEDQIHRTNAVLVHRQIVDALGDGQLLLRRQRHAVFVDGQRDHRRAVALGHRQHLRRALLAVFQVDRVDDRLARNALQRLFHHVGLGRIDQDRRRHARRNLLQDGADVSLLVFAHDGAAQVEHVRAFVHQLLGQRQDAVVVLRAHHVLEVLDARGGVHLLRDHQRLGIEVERNHRVRAGRRANHLDLALQAA